MCSFTGPAELANDFTKVITLLINYSANAFAESAGFNAVHGNLCHSDFAFKGIDMSVKDDVARVLVDFNTHGKVIGMTCISPILVAKLFGNKNPKLTLGKRASNFPFQGAMDVAESFGCQLDA